MKRKLTGLTMLAAVAIGLGLSSATAAPTIALPAFASAVSIPVAEADGGQIELANHRGDGWYPRHYRGDRWYPRHYRGDRWPPRGYRFQGPSGFYLEFNVPSARYVQPRRVVRSGNSHVSWCYARYRSYRAWDNSFQPYHGPRRECVSPYY